MKKRIEQLLNGIFEYEPVKITVVPETIEAQVTPGTVFRGSFRITGEEEKKIKGFVYSPNPRILCEPAALQGIENEIHYQIDCSGFKPGMEESGIITVSSEAGETAVPFHIYAPADDKAEEKFPVQSLASFAALAKENYQKAFRCFCEQGFYKFLEETEPSSLALYDGVMAGAPGLTGMETFLIGAGHKKAVEISAEKNELIWEELSEPVRETVTLTKSTWGYEKITVESDSRFLRPEKKQFTTEDFAGSTFDLNLVIDTNLMHSGRNSARLKISTSVQTLYIEATALRAGNTERRRQNHIRKIMTKKLEELYVSFRLKKTDLAAWIERSVSVINSYKRAGGLDAFADLFLVQLYYADGRTQKAYQILETLEHQKHRLNTPERYAYFLYMTTFFYHEASYVDRIEHEISQMFYRDKTSWKLQWILLYLQEAYLKDESARYEAVAEQFQYGCRSRIMYVEAYQILKSNPFLMRHLGAFERQLLRFAAREEILTAELVRQAASLVAHCDQFYPQLYEALEAGYVLYPSEDLVKAICLMLMKGQKKDSRYFKWYEKGVEAGLRITGLYEYYMETMECLDMQKMPQIIRMYFAYDMTLDYRKRAAIYRRIIENRESDVQTYHNYRAAIERFALDQLEALHLTDDLGMIYRSVLRKNMLTKQSARKLARLLFTYEIECSHPGLQKVVLHSKRLAGEQTAVFQNGRAQIRIYDPDSVVFVENERGERYAASSFGTLRSVMTDKKMLTWCTELAPDFPGLVLYLSIYCLESGSVSHKALPYLCTACECREFSESFRNQIREKVLKYYLEHLRDETLPDFLERIPKLEYVKVDKAALITLLAEEGRCSDAFALLDRYGAEGILLMQLVRICSRMVLDLEFEENAMLISLCHYCFSCGKYDDKLLRYLLIYYEGPIREMKMIWQAARKFELDTMLIEEKIMMLILFTRSETQGSEPVFESYLSKMGRRKICRAYVNLKAYEYFVKELPVADSLFKYMERDYLYLKKKGRLDEQEEVCRLALLKHYAKALELTQQQRTCVEELLEEFSARGLRFAFWQCFDRKLLAPYQMEGRVFAEYVCNPKHTVSIAWRIVGRTEEFVSEMMQDYFNGVFVREFTLFEGEELECYLEEDDGTQVRTSDRRILTALAPAGDCGRYAMLNRICRAKESGEQEKVQTELEAYLMLEYLAEQVFTLV